MRVFYDYVALLMQKYGGVSRYFYEIISQIRKEHKDVEAVIKASVSKN